jgi:hypothetical protein
LATPGIQVPGLRFRALRISANGMKTFRLAVVFSSPDLHLPVLVHQMGAGEKGAV